MQILSKILALIFITTTLQGCNGMSKQGGGTLIGGVTGGLIGSQFGKGGGQIAAVGIGALAGALVGGHIGKTLDAHDKLLLEKSSRQALEFTPAGNSVEWHNPDSGNHGSITPTKTFKTNQGEYCREYVQEIIVGGKKQSAYGKACRKPDGNWQIVQ